MSTEFSNVEALVILERAIAKNIKEHSDLNIRKKFNLNVGFTIYMY